MGTQTVVKSRYELKGILGEGGMGIVYRAYDTATKRFVALKTLRDAADPRALDLFAKEWTVLAGLSHPNIVDILDCGEFKENGTPRPFFVMPLLPGKTLDDLIRNSSQRLTVERTIEVLVQTCRGLQAAHERGLVHRDLKPSNIFVMEDDTVKIIDFGVVHLTGTRSLTTVKGTLQYMAPEQLELKTTALSDIFSLGVVGYEALSGRKPFARATDDETAEAVRHHFPPPVFEISPGVSPLIGRVIHKAMAKEPWHRFASAREFAELLQKAARNQPIDIFDPVRIQPRIERARKAQAEGDLQFANEIVSELESEGHIDPDITALKQQIDAAARERNIRQLLDGARIRLDEGEHPLALQKIQEILELDPRNSEALRLQKEIEGRRNERQLDNWLRLARQSLDRAAFPEARQSIDQAFKLSPSDSRVQQLQAELTRLEEENALARAEKERLYQAAREAFQNGEISSALSKLERVLQLTRKTPDRGSPERDAVYQSFYNQVRSENDSIRMAYAEARRQLTEKNFAKAMALCDEALTKHPGNALFQALKLEITEQEQQELVAYSADVARRMDAEPDLERKLNIVKEAVARYPSELRFQHSLRLAGERRDLVLSIVAKARQYEQRGQLAESISQWEILSSIYPQYPGLAFELEQLKRRRDLQTADEGKSRWLRQIDRALAGTDFERACGLTLQALTEYPNDTELKARERSAYQGIERMREALRLSEEGRQCFSVGKFAEAVELLRRAWQLNGNSSEVRSALVAALVAWAQTLAKDKPDQSEALVNEALSLDPNHAGAVALRSSLLAAKRPAQAVAAVVPPEPQPEALKTVKYEEPPPSSTRIVKRLPRLTPRTAGLIAIPALLIAAMVATYWPRKKPTPPPPPPHEFNVDIKTNAAGFIVKVDGTVTGLPARLVEGPHGIEVSAPGYLSQIHSIRVQAGMAPLIYDLQPEPLRLIIAGLPAGKVTLDQQDAGELQDGRFVKDDLPMGDHTLVIGNGNKPILELSFKAVAAASPQLTAPVKTQDMAVAAGFGDRIRIYGSANLKAGIKDQPAQPIPDQGLEFPIVSAGAELDIGNGTATHPITLEAVNYPHLTIYANVFGPTQPILVISANVDNPQISINGNVEDLKPYKGKFYKKLNPGQYVVKLSAPSYLPSEQTVEIAKNDNLKKLEFNLDKAPVFASLSIEGGTPGAQLVFGETTGTLDASGNFSADKIQPGEYELRLSKDLFEPKTLGRRKFEAGQQVRITDAKLTPFGSLLFDVVPAEAQLSYRREGESEYRPASNGATIPVRQGTYNVRASATGWEPLERKFTVEPGHKKPVSLELPKIITAPPPPPPPKSPFETPPSWKKDDDGLWEYQGGGWGFLRPEIRSVNLTFHKKKKLGFSLSKFEWAVTPSSNVNDGVQYHLTSGGGIGRKKLEKHVAFNNDLTVSISVETRTITVRAGGELIDQYSGEDFSKWKIAVKKDVHVAIPGYP